MKLGVDIQCTLGKITGIPRYTLNLLEALSELDDSPEIIPFHSEIQRDLKTYERFWWETVKLPSQISKSGPDLCHVPGFGIRKMKNQKIILTAHDLIGYLFPKNLSKTAQLYWAKWLPWCYKNADHLIVDAENTKNDLLKHLKIPEKKISVVYIAEDPKCRRVPAEEARNYIADSMGVTDPYFLFVGTIEPRKNLVRTLQAYAKALKINKDLPKFLVVGAKEWGTEHFEKTINDLSLESHVIATGFVSDDALWRLYSAAYAVVFVSIYEGFGLPLVEAYRCGAPVIASNNSSLFELAKGSAYIVDPYSVDEISQALLTLAGDSNLCKDLSEKGLKRSEDFSWKKTAQQTLDVYKKVLS
jgi:glycosyltransferase involved in cell wall biosynthesis